MSTIAQNRRIWLGGGAVVAVLMVVLGWFFVVNPELVAADSTRAQAESARQQNTVLQNKNAKLKAANDNVELLRAGLATALAELPYDSGLPEFTRQLAAQATANSVVLSSVVVGGATPVTAAVAAAAAGATDATAPAADTSAPVADAAATAGLLAIAVTVAATGPCGGDIEFLKAIQVAGPRRALVTDVQLAPVTGAEPCVMTLQLTVFSAPLSPEAQAALVKLLSGT